MTTPPESLLIDVIALSHLKCRQPIEGRLAYATPENFLGRVVAGYHPDAMHLCLLTREPAEQLCAIQNELLAQGLSLFIFDAYRPLRAVQDFCAWYQEPLKTDYELQRKQVHFPHLTKADLVRLGYAPDQISQHCFGHTVDLSLIDLTSGKLLNMGTEFDYFDTSSHLNAPEEVIGKEAVANRRLLLEVMQKRRFVPYDCEWWHFSYEKQEVQEPIDIPITLDLAGLGLQTPH